MCKLCAITATFDPTRHVGRSADAFSQIFEDEDAVAGVTTSYEIAVGESFVGTRSSAGDDDWVAITLTAGETYIFDADGSLSGGGSLYDTDLYLYDASGTQLAYDDLSGTSWDAELKFTANYTGTYYVGISAYFESNTGTYTMTASLEAVPEIGTLDELADYLTDGYWESLGGSKRHFDTTTNNEITVNITGLTAAGQQLARWAFEAWEMVADLVFVETSAPNAFILFDDNEPDYAYSTSDLNWDGTIQSSFVNVATNWLDYYGTSMTSYSFATYIHEIGHALGLGHQGSYNGSATYGVDEVFLNDSWQMSVMSYFSQTENTSINASYAAITSTMMADIVAIQNLYGAPGANGITAGDTIWGSGTNLGGYLRNLMEYSGSKPIAYTIYDQGGIDLLSLTGVNTDNSVNMNSQSFSDVGGLIGNIGIARGTVIENAILGDGNDTVIGNQVNNQIGGGKGHDHLSGGAGNDTLEGGDGRDTLAGGSGTDELSYASSDAGTGVSVNLGSGYTGRRAAGDQISGFENLTGTDIAGSADFLTGTRGDNVLRGLAGNDRLDGGRGDDTLDGGSGRDILVGGSGADELSYASSETGTGVTVNLGSGYTGRGAMGDQISGFESLTGTNIAGSADFLTGTRGDNYLRGLAGNDHLNGGRGNDTLEGGTGDDALRGGSGEDTFIFSQKVSSDLGADSVLDFSLSQDVLVFDSSTTDEYADLTFENGQDEVHVHWAGGTVTLEGLSNADLGEEHFLFT